MCAIALIGCECVPNAETPKKIEPTQFGKARIVNCNMRYRGFKLRAGDIAYERTIDYDAAESPLEKLPAGRVNIRLQSGGDIFINQLADIVRDSDYVLIAYGEKNFSRMLMLKDDFSAGQPRARFALVADLPLADFSLSNGEFKREYRLLARGASETEDLPPGVYDVQVTSESLPEIIFKEKLTVEPGFSYLIAFRGSKGAAGGAPLEIYSVKTPLAK